MSKEKLISKKKPAFPVNQVLYRYLKKHGRTIQIPIFYDDLLRFQGAISVYDKNDNDTLWIRVFYSEFEREEIDTSLKKVYNILLSNGQEDNLKYLNIDAIDFCTFGNSKPFRIKVRNILNDNYTYFYVKKTDASRIYGLELEDMLSPYNLNYLVYEDTLIEEHIAGVPGDVFIKERLEKCTKSEKSQIAKEFVKFNERCLIRLLGDMRSYNYVIVPVHDFENVIYRIRPIDFDQQCYEGRFKVYYPQFFKENFPMVKLVGERLNDSSIEQYKVEERSIIAKRILSSRKRLVHLLKCMKHDHISTPEKIDRLQKEIFDFTKDINFKDCKTMGEILDYTLTFVRRNYEDVSTKRIINLQQRSEKDLKSINNSV
ncbi:hypothetical protein [Tenacibaculum geojense]|uniref:RNA ligase n=1 Tax=Tenacibaculum geojense TaxID=915352 RepID=A0ABW3JQ84_9FLAO